MHVSRLLFHTVPGKTGRVEHELKNLRDFTRGNVGLPGPRRGRLLPSWQPAASTSALFNLSPN